MITDIHLDMTYRENSNR